MNELKNGLPDPLTPLSEKNRSISRTVSDAVQRALALEPSERPAEVRELRAMLGGAPGGSDSGEPDENTVPAAAVQGGTDVTPAPESVPMSARPTEVIRTSAPSPTTVLEESASGEAGAETSKLTDEGAGTKPPADGNELVAAESDPGATRSYIQPATAALALLGLAALIGLLWYGLRAQRGDGSPSLVQSEATQVPLGAATPSSAAPPVAPPATSPAATTAQAGQAAPSLEFRAPPNLREIGRASC